LVGGVAEGQDYVGRGYDIQVVAEESRTRVITNEELSQGKEETEVRTASRNPRSKILFVVTSTLPVLRRS